MFLSELLQSKNSCVMSTDHDVVCFLFFCESPSLYVKYIFRDTY